MPPELSRAPERPQALTLSSMPGAGRGRVRGLVVPGAGRGLVRGLLCHLCPCGSAWRLAVLMEHEVWTKKGFSEFVSSTCTPFA